METVEERLVHHLRETAFSDIPPEAINAARREILWTLGTSVGGAGAKGSAEVATYVRRVGGSPEATVMGFGDRVPANMAGLANGVFAKALEYEDKFWMDYSHAYAIATAIVPAAFAMAEHVGGVDGKALLRAVALATDVQMRLVRAILYSRETGWNSTFTFANFGSAMVAGALMGLDHEEFMNAMGLVYSQTTGNYQGHQEGVLGIRLMMGFAVRNGITAVELAELGITGVHQFLTGKFGLYPLFFKDRQIDMDSIAADLGQHFAGVRLGFKAYPCCAPIHPVLDAVLPMLSEEPADLEIESIEVFGTTRMSLPVEPREMRKNPKNYVDTQFSLPWALACAVVDRKVSLSQFTPAAVESPRYRELARKVDVDMDAKREGVWVDIKLKDGRTLHSQTVVAPKGHHENPLSTEEMIEKYRDCVQYGPKPLAVERAERAKDLVLTLEEVPDVSEIVRLLG